jgi:hypothetical protein
VETAEGKPGSQEKTHARMRGSWFLGFLLQYGREHFNGPLARRAADPVFPSRKKFAGLFGKAFTTATN